MIATGGRRLLAAVNPAAAAAGLAPGMPLADALSFLPGLRDRAGRAGGRRGGADPARRMVRPLQPMDRARRRRRHQDRDHRLRPFVGRRGGAGGRPRAAALARQGIAHRIAIAGTLGAAWALARFAAGPAGRPCRRRKTSAPRWRRCRSRRCGSTRRPCRGCAGSGCGGSASSIRCRATRSPAVSAKRCARASTRRSATCRSRCRRLGEAPVRRVRLSFAEPIADPADLARAIERLAEDLAARLAREGVGRAGSTSPFTASTAGSSISASAPPGRAATPAISPACSPPSSTRSIPGSGSRT